MNVRTLVLTALFLAMTTATTIVVAFPIPLGANSGYVNIGDSIIFVASAVLNPISAFVVGGVGSMLADFILGYAAFAPFTLLVKGLEGVACALIFYAFKKTTLKIQLISFCAGALVMIIGYFFVGILFTGVYTSLLSSIFNIIQGVISITVALALLPQVKRLLANMQKYKEINKKGG